MGSSVLYPNKNVLVIDAGTCITFDFIDLNKVYQGGRISPGIEMRYKSLHEFTGHNLPKITFHSDDYFIGKSIRSR